jgi:hypothetical protein
LIECAASASGRFVPQLGRYPHFGERLVLKKAVIRAKNFEPTVFNDRSTLQISHPIKTLR